MKSLFLTLLICCLVFIRLDRLFFKKNGSFGLNCIQPKWALCPQLETIPSDDLASILDQNFTYWTKGKQSFVFKSQDQQWVLKFLRLPKYVREGGGKGKKESLMCLKQTWANCKAAYEELSKETGIVYAHLEPTDFLHQKITLIDLFEKTYTLDSDNIPFILQKCGNSYFTKFIQMDEKSAKNMIAKTIDLFIQLHTKGFIDKDPILDKNFGICEEDPFIIDVGQLEKCSSLSSRKEYILEMTQSLRGYLMRESPELYAYYNQILKFSCLENLP